MELKTSNKKKKVALVVGLEWEPVIKQYSDIKDFLDVRDRTDLDIIKTIQTDMPEYTLSMSLPLLFHNSFLQDNINIYAKSIVIRIGDAIPYHMRGFGQSKKYIVLIGRESYSKKYQNIINYSIPQFFEKMTNKILGSDN